MPNILALDLSTKFLYQPGTNSLHEFDNYCVVYIFLFPNNKKYCGFSSNISHRWRTQTNYSKCPLVWKAIQKYGWDNIKKYIIFKSAIKQEALDMEYQTIKNLDLLNPQFGYNLVDGGGALPHNATLNLSEEQIEHKRQITKQMWQNPETAEYMKQRMREEDHISRMQKTAEERKIIWGTHNLGRTPSNAKTILQIDINTNEVLNEYPSARQAAIALGLDPKSSANIQRTARERDKQLMVINGDGKMSNILALDLSTRSSGWATKVDGNLESGVLTSASTTIEKRIAFMRDEIINLIRKYNIDTIVVEEVHAEYTHNSTVNQKLNWLQGCIRVAVWEYNKNIKIKTILPNSWRAKIGIKTGRGVTRDILKQKDIEYVLNKYGKKVLDDEADSICILDAYCGDPTSMLVSKSAKLPLIGSEESAF